VFNVVGGTENDMIVNMIMVYVRGDYIGIFVLQEPVCKLDSYPVRFIIRDLSGHKRLYQMKALVVI
jgi:hypothetical protein